MVRDAKASPSDPASGLAKTEPALGFQTGHMSDPDGIWRTGSKKNPILFGSVGCASGPGRNFTKIQAGLWPFMAVGAGVPRSCLLTPP